MGVSGEISASNSLVGSTVDDEIGLIDVPHPQIPYGVTALSNGNYVVASSYWNNNTGAATWGNGTTGVTGVVSASNSLVGSQAGGYGSYWHVTALSDGNYVVGSDWQNMKGAATWGNGTTGVNGMVSTNTSLVGSTAYDFVSRGGITALDNGKYAVLSPSWDNGAMVDAGAVTFGAGAACSAGLSAAVGPITGANSVRGTTASGGSTLNFTYEPPTQQLVVGRPADNIVSLFKFSCDSSFPKIFLPLLVK
jgi:hypothetical protein